MVESKDLQRRAASPPSKGGLGGVEAGVEEPSSELLLQAYYWMRLTRAFDERADVIFKQGLIIGARFSQMGHEAISVGAALALAPEDMIAPMHRDLGAYLVRGLTPRRVMAQLLGRVTGPSRGRSHTRC